MKWGGELMLGGLALFCIIVALSVGSGDKSRLPPGWSNTTPERRAASGRFIRYYCLSLAALLLMDAAVIGRLPWKFAAVIVTAGGILAFIAAAVGVRRFSSFSD